MFNNIPSTKLVFIINMTNKLTILYGSQTGTAQDLSERLWREATYYGITGHVQSMDEYGIQNLIHESIVIFVCSTTGQGDEPDNMKQSWKFLRRKELPNTSLNNVKFAVLGLGDSSYEKFNFCAKKLYRRLLQLGGKSAIEPGYADEQHDLGLDAVVDPWIKKLWENLSHVLPLNLPKDSNRVLFPPKWSMKILPKYSCDILTLDNASLRDSSTSVTCIENKRVTSENHFQETRLIKFTSKNLKYNPGDVLMLKPQNSEESVERLFAIFSERKEEINEDIIVTLDRSSAGLQIPAILQIPRSLKWLATNYWDLNMVPRRYTFEILSHFADNELERDKLIEFTTAEGQEELYNYCNRPKRTILEVLADFPHTITKLPLTYFFEIFRPIQWRAYSIASSPTKHPDELHILVAVVKYKTNLKLPRLGLCSNWLSKLKLGMELQIELKNGSFNFPSSRDTPIIMIGPGTGIAPFRSKVHEMSAMDDAFKNVVFFGCRNRKSDFYFEEEWQMLLNDGRFNIFFAFSREQTEKIYVQHVIENNSKFISDLLLNENAYVFVAGNSKNMPEAVRSSLISCCSTHAPHFSKDEMEKIFKEMDRRGRYQTETWF